ncbi:MAG: endonuclease MutS2, partial [Bacteroidaceae bacterium]
MIYPKNFESKIGFNEIRTILRGRCLSSLGAEEVGKMTFSTDTAVINSRLAIVREFRSIMNEDNDFPTQNYNDMRSTLVRLQIKGTYMDEAELFNLRNTMDTMSEMVKFLLATKESVVKKGKEEECVVYKYPLLAKMARDVELFPRFIIQTDSILNSYGKIKDDASPELSRVRTALVGARRSVGISLRTILQKAQEDGIVDKDITPTYRDGRLVIPIKPGMKRKLRGIVHDESATGKTVFIEPTEVVEANNRIRTLEAEEQRAIIIILQAMAEIIRPQIPKMLEALSFIGKIDFIRAKSIFAEKTEATEPMFNSFPIIDWIMARHPLLEASLRKQNREIMPLDIKLSKENRILLISGPNAGGKSVCLKTVALLQYMMQCGLSVPIRENSKVGVFDSIFIDIGDEQ